VEPEFEMLREMLMSGAENVRRDLSPTDDWMPIAILQTDIGPVPVFVGSDDWIGGVLHAIELTNATAIGMAMTVWMSHDPTLQPSLDPGAEEHLFIWIADKREQQGWSARIVRPDPRGEQTPPSLEPWSRADQVEPGPHVAVLVDALSG